MKIIVLLREPEMLFFSVEDLHCDHKRAVHTLKYSSRLSNIPPPGVNEDRITHYTSGKPFQNNSGVLNYILSTTTGV